MPEFGLGAYLVDRGILSREQLEQALQSQVVYGARLGTNLVELGFLSLDDVAVHLAACTGFPLPPKEWLEAPDEMAVAALPRELAERHAALPLRVDAAGLHVALLDPEGERVHGAISRAVRRPVRPYVLPELRLRYALERHLGIPRPVRFMNVARRLERVRRRVAVEDHASLPEEARLRAELGIRPLGAGEDLIDESSFAALHQRLAAAREQAAGGPPPAAHDPSDELLLDEELPEELEAGATPEPEPDAFALEEELAGAGDREAAASVALALARRHVAAAALFVVHRGMVMGLAGAGQGLESHVEGILVPVDSDSVFAGVAQSGEAFRGPPPKSGIDARVLRALGRAEARELAVVPIAIRGRVVNLLYADDGTRPLAETSLGALRALAACVARAYETLIVRRKQAT